MSYHGQLLELWDIKLDDLKTLAQSEDEAEQALAQVSIGSHIFEVRDKGMPRFPYVLADNCFFIKINRKPSKTLPMAHVQISSEYLAAVGLEAAEQDLRMVINTLGIVDGSASVSRADLFLDFVCADNLAMIEQPDWITRANLMAKYFDCRLTEPFTGWVIGMGGNLHARLYEKVIEIVNKSHKTYLFEIWQANGWQVEEKVWRMEFQTEKQTLKELGTISLSDLLKQQAALWHYLTHEWLRLSIPNPNDTKRDRWPNHPLWDAIASVYALQLDQPRLKRFRPARLPADERLFVHGLGGLTSFMASRGIEDFGEGLGEYLHQAQEFHASKGEPFHSYVGRKVKAKARKYNTIENQKIGSGHRADCREKMMQTNLPQSAPARDQQHQTVDYLIPRKTVEKLSGLSRATIYHLIKSGKFPRPLSIGTGSVRWRQSDIIAWQLSLRPSS